MRETGKTMEELTGDLKCLDMSWDEAERLAMDRDDEKAALYEVQTWMGMD